MKIMLDLMELACNFLSIFLFMKYFFDRLEKVMTDVNFMNRKKNERKNVILILLHTKKNKYSLTYEN